MGGLFFTFLMCVLILFIPFPEKRKLIMVVLAGLILILLKENLLRASVVQQILLTRLYVMLGNHHRILVVGDPMGLPLFDTEEFEQTIAADLRGE